MMNIKIPKSIKIGGYRYRILHTKQSDKDLTSINRDGETSYHQMWIKILSHLEPIQQSELFLHEILHVVNNLYNTSDLNEGEITRMANGLHQVMEGLGIRFIL